MYPYGRVLIGLDMSEKDNDVISYCANIQKHIACNDIFFIHITPPYDLPQEIRSHYPELEEPTTENLRTTLRNKVRELLTECHDEEPMFYVREGHPVEVILKTVKHDNIDLVVIGRKSFDDKHASVARALARQVPCSVLIVPEGSSPVINKIIVPIDFSEHSRLAVESAIRLSSTFTPHIPVFLFHVYHVPHGYTKTGKSYEEFAEIIKTNAMEEYNEFMEEIDTGEVPVESEFELSEEIDETILDKAHASRSDLIIIGARGRSATAALLLGSLTEKLIQKSRMPLFAVKKKDENMGLLDAILNL